MSAVGDHDRRRVVEAALAATVGVADALGGPARDLGDYREAAHALAIGYADALASCIHLGIDDEDVLALRAASEERCKATLSALHRADAAGCS